MKVSVEKEQQELNQKGWFAFPGDGNRKWEVLWIRPLVPDHRLITLNQEGSDGMGRRQRTRRKASLHYGRLLMLTANVNLPSPQQEVSYHQWSSLM